MNAKRKISQILVCAWMVSLSSPVTAKRVLPEFSGYWYDDVTIQYYDACYNPVYTYHHKSQGDPIALAQELLNDVPVNAPCQWGEIYAEYVNSSMYPHDFVGNRDDWNEIRKDHQLPMQQRWKRDCKNNQGMVINSRDVLLQPSYACPKNSREGLDIIGGSFGCLTTAPPCLADIVGRDLSAPGFGFLGHVGLAQQSFADTIIEVLKDPKEAIYLHNLFNFKQLPGISYWGERYGLLDEKNMAIEKADKITRAASFQMKYPFQYTLGWDYHPGNDAEISVYNQQTQEWQKINATQGAKFRCDCFIYYSYFTGANLTIFSQFTAPVVPQDMFNRFVSCRDTDGAICLPNNVIPPLATRVELSQLKSLFSSKNIDIRLADSSTQLFIKDSHIPRATKLNQLWSMAIQHQDNPSVFGYLVDILSILRPIELSPEIIQSFQDQRNSENQHHLLTLLVDSLHFKGQINLLDEKALLPNVIKIQNFVHDVLYQSNDKEILKYAIQLYPSVVTAEIASRDIKFALSRPDMMSSQFNLLTDEEKTLATLRIAFSTYDQQKKLLPTLIEKNYSNRLFNYSLCFILSGMAPERIDSSVKEKISRQLERQKKTLMEKVINQRPGAVRDTLICNWLNAYAVVNATSEAEKEQFMLHYIRNEPDVFMQAGLLSQLSWQLENKLLSSEDRAYYRNRFFEALQSKNAPQNNDPKNDILKMGVSQMYEKNKT